MSSIVVEIPCEEPLGTVLEEVSKSTVVEVDEKPDPQTLAFETCSIYVYESPLTLHDPFLDVAINAANKSEEERKKSETAAGNSLTWAGDSEAAAVRAEDAATKAEGHEVSAGTSASQAAGSATAAAGSADGANTSMEDAETAQIGAEAAQIIAEDAADRAESAAGKLEFPWTDMGTWVPIKLPDTPNFSAMWYVASDGTVDGVEWTTGDYLYYSKKSGFFSKVYGLPVDGSPPGDTEITGDLIMKPTKAVRFEKTEALPPIYGIGLDRYNDLVIGDDSGQMRRIDLICPNADNIVAIENYDPDNPKNNVEYVVLTAKNGLSKVLSSLQTMAGALKSLSWFEALHFRFGGDKGRVGHDAAKGSYIRDEASGNQITTGTTGSTAPKWNDHEIFHKGKPPSSSDINAVDLTSDQTVGGSKTFSEDLSVVSSDTSVDVTVLASDESKSAGVRLGHLNTEWRFESSASKDFNFARHSSQSGAWMENPIQIPYSDQAAISTTRNIVTSAAQSTNDGALTKREFVVGLDNANVKINGDQVIDGAKTFTSANSAMHGVLIGDAAKSRPYLYLPDENGSLNVRVGPTGSYKYFTLASSGMLTLPAKPSGYNHAARKDYVDDVVGALDYDDVGAVPTTRKVAGKPLSSDVALVASDVGAVPTTRTVNKRALSTDIALNAGDVGAAEIDHTHTGYVPTTRKVAGKPLSADVVLDAGDVGAAEIDHTHTGYVPTTRKVAGKPLSSDVTLVASDVGAVPTTRTVNTKPLSADIVLDAGDVGAAEAVHTHANYVPTTRTVNTKPLSADIVLDAGDVGAAEADHTHANYVPTTRTVNSKPLSTNIVLDSDDVGAVPVGGNAGSADSLSTPRNIGLSGGATGQIPFDGSADVSIPVTVTDYQHKHKIANVDSLQSTLDKKVDLTSVQEITGKKTFKGEAIFNNSATVNSLEKDVNSYKVSIYAQKLFGVVNAPEGNNGVIFGFNGTYAKKGGIELYAPDRVDGTLYYRVNGYHADENTDPTKSIGVWETFYTSANPPAVDAIAGAVPETRKVAGKPLSADVSLVAADVTGAVPNTRKVAGKPLSADVAIATGDVDGLSTALSAKVPNTRKVAGKPLSSDVVLTADDVGALPSGGSAESAKELETARTITLTDGAKGSVSFDGSKNVSMSVTIPPTGHDHPISQINDLQTELNKKFNKTGGTVTGVIQATGSIQGNADISFKHKTFQAVSSDPDVTYIAFGSTLKPTKIYGRGALIYRDNATDRTIYHTGNNPKVADISGAVPNTRKVAGKALTTDVTLVASDVGAVPTTRKVAGKPLSADVTLIASDVGAVPTTRTVNNKALSANITLNSGDVGAVPTTRTVNKKPLSSDVTLGAGDVGAVPTGRTINSKPLTTNIVLDAGDVGAAEAVHTHANYVPTTRTVNSKPLSTNIVLDAGDVGAAEADHTHANYVPTTRTVNSKPLSSDVTLVASDVKAVPTTRKVNNKALSADITLSASDVKAVPTTRKVNGKALSTDITLGAGDVGAAPQAGNSGQTFSVASPTADDHAATKKYVDDRAGGVLPLTRGGASWCVETWESATSNQFKTGYYLHRLIPDSNITNRKVNKWFHIAINVNFPEGENTERTPFCEIEFEKPGRYLIDFSGIIYNYAGSYTELTLRLTPSATPTGWWSTYSKTNDVTNDTFNMSYQIKTTREHQKQSFYIKVEASAKTFRFFAGNVYVTRLSDTP